MMNYFKTKKKTMNANNSIMRILLVFFFEMKILVVFKIYILIFIVKIYLKKHFLLFLNILFKELLFFV